MADIKLTLAMTPYDRVLPLINGEVKPEGITIDYVGFPQTQVGNNQVFYEQIKFRRWDISEMSLSTVLRMRSIGWPYRALPVFHNHNFAYATTEINKSSGIRQDHPEDLKGKRIGIGDYQQTLGLWARGVLQMEFGIKPEDMVWYQGRSEHFSLTGASAEDGLALPKALELHHAKTPLNTMLRKGELDACLSYAYGIRLDSTSDAGINRRRDDRLENSDIVTLFADPRKEAIRYFKKTGVYPPHHTTVIRESILDEYPWVANSLMVAFEQSKEIAIERFRRRLARSLMVFGQYYIRELDEIFGLDPFPYGIKANAKAFDMAQTMSVQQGLSERKQPLDEIFPHEVIYREEQLP